MARLLLLEDDMNLSQTLCEFLEDEGFEVVCVYEGEAAQEALYEKQFDLLLLDVNVPNINGFALLKEARKAAVATPAIFITSRDGLADVESGFASGCDDYIRKPFALKELLLRVRSLLRREFGHVGSAVVALGEEVAFDTVGNALHVKGQTHPLGRKEAQLLAYFLKRRGEVLSHEALQEALWSYEETPSETALRTYIKNLRKLIGKEKIVSFKKLGYKLTTA
ncbi:response regulator transcription factor [Sulfurospirillum tamanense]